jgi:23S rRNA pseudouridine955/2504/2580 synthase
MAISPSRILFRDDHLLAVNKLSGELVVSGSGKSEKLALLDFLRRQYPGLRSLHRLDFETSGVVVFARTKQAFEAVMASKFRGWKKVYVTLIAGRLPHRRGEIRLRLPARGKGLVPAITHYCVLEEFGNSSLVEAEIGTGRHHQIRRHFAAVGHPLVLDAVYGQQGFNRVFTREFGYRRFFLHAARLALPHPVTGKPLTIEAPMPRVFEEVLERLRKCRM